MAFMRAVELDDLWSGAMSACVVEGTNVLLIRDGERVLAYEDRCAHLGVALSCGRLEKGVLTCSAHEWQYEAATGRGINPSTVRLRAFPVKVEEGHVLVDVRGSLG